MSLIVSVIFTIIGGLVAGGVGYFATIVSLKEQRKERHLEGHKTNLKAVSKALDQVFAEAWIFVSGSDQLKLPEPQFGNEKGLLVPNLGRHGCYWKTSKTQFLHGKEFSGTKLWRIKLFE